MVSSMPGAAAVASPKKTSRYPGVRPFGDGEIHRRLFRGREDEKYELLQLILAERLVLVFARSGIGKSSLINAGLMEPLRGRGYFPMVVRVGASTGTSPADCLYNGVKAAVDQAHRRGQIEFEPPEEAWNRSSLWHFFKTLELWRHDRLLLPVLVIDQFEELFTLHAAAQRKQFIHELADLVRGTRPRESSQDSGATLSDTPPEVKVVLALREDFYANLEELRHRIPTVYKAPFRLKPLSREQARRAIVEPAALEGEDFSTPAFSWSDEALSMVLDFLSEQQLGEGKTTVGKEIEPFQLQLICQHVEEKVRQGKLVTVTAHDLDGTAELKSVLSSFYEDSLQKICAEFPGEERLRERLERLCEYGFITSRGRRLLREESTIKQDDGVGPEVLQAMVEHRLLRKEPRVGDNYYELTHDTLIEPIQLSRRAREERQEAAANKRARTRLALAGVAATAIFAAFGTWALWERAALHRVSEAKQQAVAAREQAEREAQRAELSAERALAAKRQALVEKQESVDFAAKAQRVAGEEEAKRRLAEAETQLAAIQPLAIAAQKKVAEAKLQAAEAKGRDYEAEAKRMLADAEDALRDAAGQVESAQEAVLAAKTGVMLAQANGGNPEGQLAAAGADGQRIGRRPAMKKAIDGKRALSKSGQKNAIVSQQSSVLDNVETSASVSGTTQNQPGLLNRQNANIGLLSNANLQGLANASVHTQNIAMVPPAVEKESPLEGLEKVDLAALEVRENNPEITDAELLIQYRELIETGGSDFSAEQVKNIQDKLGELERAAEAFAGLKRKDQDPDFSICEAFDHWSAYRPRRALGPEAQYRDLRLAELGALLQDVAVVTTQQNFITSDGEAGNDLKETFTLGKDRVYIHAWINAPRTEAVRLSIRQGDVEASVWKGKPVERNPLRGARAGYHLWTYKGANALGRHELRLYNAKNSLICRREFEIVAAGQ